MRDEVSPVSVSIAGAAVLAGPDEASDVTSAGTATVTATAELSYADPSVESPPPAIRPGESLRSRAIRGTLWTTGGYGASQIIRLAANLVLTRLLSPPTFGLMNLVNTFIQGLQGFSDVGIGPAIIQNKRGDEPAFLNTAWTIQVLRGVVLAAVATLIAWPIARLYSDRQLVWLMPVAGLTALIAGFNSTALFTLNRHLEVGKLTVRNLAAQVVGAAVMVGWAMLSPSVWALVAGNLAAVAASLALSHTLLPGVRNRFHWDRSDAAELMKFGRWIFVSTVLTFLALQGDRLIFGKLLSRAEFGVYGVAAMMASLPTMTLLRLGSTVVFPAYSRAKAKDAKRSESTSNGHNGAIVGAQFQRVFDLVRLPLLAAGGLAAAGLIAGGPPIIQVLYDPRYHAAGSMVQLLAISGWFQVLQVSNGSALLALGSPKSVAASNVVKLVAMVICIPVGFRLRGLAGAITGMIVSDVLKYLVTVLAARRKGLHMVVKDLLLSLLVAATAGAAVFAGWLVHGRLHVPDGVPGPSDSAHTVGMRLAAVAELLAMAAVAAAVWVPVIVRTMRSRKAVA